MSYGDQSAYHSIFQVASEIVSDWGREGSAQRLQERGGSHDYEGRERASRLRGQQRSAEIRRQS